MGLSRCSLSLSSLLYTRPGMIPVSRYSLVLWQGNKTQSGFNFFRLTALMLETNGSHPESRLFSKQWRTIFYVQQDRSVRSALCFHFCLGKNIAILKSSQPCFILCLSLCRFLQCSLLLQVQPNLLPPPCLLSLRSSMSLTAPPLSPPQVTSKNQPLSCSLLISVCLLGGRMVVMSNLNMVKWY